MSKSYIQLTAIEDGNLIPITIPIDSFWYSIAAKGGCHIHFFHRDHSIKVNEPFNYISSIIEKDGGKIYELPDDEEEEKKEEE